MYLGQKEKRRKRTSHATKLNGSFKGMVGRERKRQGERLTTSTPLPPLLPTVATVLLPTNTNPPADADVVVVVELAITNPVSALVEAVTPPPPPLTTDPSTFTVPEVMIPPIVPLHAAPEGQHATFPA